jgi:hypothetical protein
MESYNIIVSGNTTDLHTHFSTPLHLDAAKQYVLAIVNLETYNSFPNVDSTNNQFDYMVGKDQRKITIPEGAYEIADIASFLITALGREGQTDVIEIIPNVNTLKCSLKIKKPNFSVSFVGDRTLRDLLGFEAKIYNYNDRPHEGTRNVDILKVNSILIHCDIIAGSYIDGENSPTLYSFFPNVSPGYKIVESPHNLIYLPVTTYVIREMRVWLTDQSNRSLNLRGETVTIRLHLKSL